MVITNIERAEIKLMPATVEEEAAQNLAVLLACTQYTVPLAPRLGLRASWLDGDSVYGADGLLAELAVVVREYEPRAKIDRLDVTRGAGGRANIRMEASLHE
jgi:hypothetical protein